MSERRQRGGRRSRQASRESKGWRRGRLTLLSIISTNCRCPACAASPRAVRPPASGSEADAPACTSCRATCLAEAMNGDQCDHLLTPSHISWHKIEQGTGCQHNGTTAHGQTRAGGHSPPPCAAQSAHSNLAHPRWPLREPSGLTAVKTPSPAPPSFGRTWERVSSTVLEQQQRQLDRTVRRRPVQRTPPLQPTHQVRGGRTARVRGRRAETEGRRRRRCRQCSPCCQPHMPGVSPRLPRQQSCPVACHPLRTGPRGPPAAAPAGSRPPCRTALCMISRFSGPQKDPGLETHTENSAVETHTVRGKSRAVASLTIGPLAAKQHRRRRHSRVLRGQVEGGDAAIGRPGVWVGAVQQQQLHDRRAAAERGPVERGLPATNPTRGWRQRADIRGDRCAHGCAAGDTETGDHPSLR